MFSLITGQEGAIGENIKAIGIVDRYLEHSRMFIFGNDGDPEVYLSSADFLPRNFDSRIETIFPLNDKKLRKQIIDYFELQWSDNVKARILDDDLSNAYRKRGRGETKVRGQYAIEDYLRDAN
jgi:polyphosphate kinase